MKNLKLSLPALIATLLFGFIFQIKAQSDKDLLAQLISEDQEALSALVLYPEDTRLSILEATLHPEALIKLESIQSKTSTAFRELLDGYSQNTQEMIWDLTRYPGLINILANAANNSDKYIDEALKEYPEIIRPRAKKAAEQYLQLLIEINNLNHSANSAFDALLNEYPPQAQTAFRKLIALPEVLTILTDNIRLSVLVGDIYKKDPDWIIYKTDSLSLEAARQNAQEIEDWKNTLKDNPEAKAELKKSAESFADEYAYDDEYYEYNDDDLYYDNEMEDVVIREYYHYNYPYWFSYPYWYVYPRWRLYPLWYDWGFYINPGGTFVVVGLPSYYFTNWYFHYPYHHYYYPHLSAQFANHYYGHRGVGTSSINNSVANWRNKNRDIITENWLRNDGQLAERFREYGEFESSRIKYNQSHPKNTLNKKEFLSRNSRHYPLLKQSADRKQIDRNIKKETERTKTRRTETIPYTRREPVSRKKLPSNRTSPKINKAKEYHRNTWDKTRTARPKTRQAPAPRTKAQPKIKAPKSTTPKTRSTKKKN